MATLAAHAGEEFFVKRLRRAQKAAYRGEACAEAQAFLASVPLLEAIAEALPTTPYNGSSLPRPLLPKNRDGAEVVLVSLYRYGVAKYLCPSTPVHPLNYGDALLTYQNAWFKCLDQPEALLKRVQKSGELDAGPSSSNGSSSSGGRGSSGRGNRSGRGGSRASAPAAAAAAAAGEGGISQRQLLCGMAAQVLHMWGAGEALLSQHQDREAYYRVEAALGLLKTPAAQAECDAHLAALAERHGLPPLSAAQLLYLLHRVSVNILLEVLSAGLRQSVAGLASAGPAALAGLPDGLPPPAGLTAREAARLHQMAQDNVAALRQLEPDNPRSHYISGERALQLQEGGAAPHLERCLQLATEQGSDYWQAYACARLAAVDLARAPELFEEAEAAMARCNKTLPQPWMQQLKAVLASGKSTIGHMAAMLGGAQRGPARAQGSQQVERAAVDGMLQDLGTAREAEGPPRCAHCKQYAVGLRRCARCRMVSYCSEDCQRQAWPDHRPTCKPAAH
ncbi:hypothetical protein ABPG75_013094 [Micractinium tetrahymenae]